MALYSSFFSFCRVLREGSKAHVMLCISLHVHGSVKFDIFSRAMFSEIVAAVYFVCAWWRCRTDVLRTFL